MLEMYARRFGNQKEPGDDDTTDEGRTNMANKAIEKFSREGIEQIRFYELKDSIARWRNYNRIQQRKNAAKASWTEEARRKRRKNQKSLARTKKRKK